MERSKRSSPRCSKEIESTRSVIYVTQLEIALNDLGRALSAQGDYKEALTSHQRALAIDEKKFGRDQRSVAEPLLGIGNAYLGLNETAQAIESLERALRVEGDSPDRIERAAVEFALARAVWPRDPRRANDLASAAESVYAKASPSRDDDLAGVRAWLAAHRRR